jgi:hypothetical protein
MAAASTNSCEARKHHYVPKCWLAGFTESGDVNQKLWVSDLERRNQWATTPANVGHQRDFNRLSDQYPDPLAFENFFAEVESDVAPILRRSFPSQEELYKDEFETLLVFVALQFIRVPAFRPKLLTIAEKIRSSQLREDLASKETWSLASREAGLSSDSPGADYGSMLEYKRLVIDAGKFKLQADTDFYLIRGIQQVKDVIFPALRNRRWGALYSPSGSFIGTDNPVTLDGPDGQMIGFKNAEVIIFQLNRHQILYGCHTPVRPPRVTRKLIAEANTLNLLGTQQVYSHTNEFCWLDEDGKLQEDWQLFSRERTRPQGYLTFTELLQR